MRSSVALFSIVVAGLACGTRAQQPATVQLLPSSPMSCPVDLAIQQRSPNEVVRTGDQPPGPPAQHLEIEVKSRRYVQTIDSIEIRVRGVGSARQTLPLTSGLADGSADDRQQTFALRKPANAATLHRADVRIPGINAVRWIELLSVTYVDGTVWRPAAGSPCRSQPNRLIEVAAAATSTR